MSAARLRSLAAAALAAVALASVPAAAAERDYSEGQFNAAMRGYLLYGIGDYAIAARILYEVGSGLQDPAILRDATQAALSANDVPMAWRAGEAWLDAGGGNDALRILTRIRSRSLGLEASHGLLSRIAADGGAEQVFLTIHDLEGDVVAAMRASHPLHLRDADFHAYLSLLHAIKGDLAGAEAVLAEGEELEPDSPRLALLRLLVEQRTRDDIGSVAAARALAESIGSDVPQALAVYDSWRRNLRVGHPVMPDAGDFEGDGSGGDEGRISAGSFYLRHGEPESAIDTLAEVSPASPLWVRSVRLRVEAMRTLDDSERVLGLLSSGLEETSVENIASLALMYAEEVGDTDGPEAAFAFLDGLGRGADDPDVLYGKSFYAERIGRLDSAEEALRAFIRAHPDRSDGYNALGYIFADHNVNLDEALTLIERALEIEPDSAAIIDSHGWVLYRLGALGRARERLEESLRLMGDHPHVEVMAHYGEVLWELGEREQAVRVWTSAWQIDSEDRALVDTLERYGQRVGGDRQ